MKSGKYKPYPEYKDSGVEWSGSVPIEWGISAIKREFRIVGGSTPKSDVAFFWDGQIPWATPTDLGKESTFYLSGTRRNISESGLGSCAATIVPSGSIILSSRAPIGSLAIAEVEMCTSQGCKSLVPVGSMIPKYLAYLLSVTTKELNIRGKGTTFLELSGEEVGAFEIPTPSHSEQTKIADFLDHETAKIDLLIEKQLALIDLLTEKRQAVISRAVTKGLNPDAPMKDSCMEWLGQVPEHWDVKPLKYLAQLQTGMTPPTNDLANYTEDEMFQWICPDDLNQMGLPTKSSRFLTKKGWDLTRQLPSKSTLICCIGTIGKVGITDSIASTNQQITAALPKINSKFLFYVISAGRSVLEVSSTGNVLRILNTERLGSIRFPCPPPSEQNDIVGFLDEKIPMLDNITTRAQETTVLLHERRDALISAAVTGKIDVRDWKAPASKLPEANE